MIFFFCVGVMYSGEQDVCNATLSVYSHRASLKNMPGHGGNRTYDLEKRARVARAAEANAIWHIFQISRVLC